MSALITRPQRRILETLASFEALGLRDMAKSNVAVFSDQSPKSSGFTNNLGTLRNQLGLIHYPVSNRVALTDAGRDAVESYPPINSLSQLHDAWFAKLPNPQVRILKALIEIYPDSIAKDDLAQCAEQSFTSSGYTNNLGALRGLGLIDYPHKGYAVATELLFPDGLLERVNGAR